MDFLTKILDAYKLNRVRSRFYDYFQLNLNHTHFIKITKRNGYFNQIKSLENYYLGKRCFIMAGGPSIKELNLDTLKNDIIIGVNGAYRLHLSKKVKLSYLIIEDEYTLTTAKDDLDNIQDIPVFLSEQNARQYYRPNRVIYFRTNYKPGGNYWKHKLMFSSQFHYIAFLGGTVTYLALQFAHHLGCNPIYLLGVDFNYGERYQAKMRPFQGKTVVIDEELLEILKETHFSSNYLEFKVGQLHNVPNFDLQKRAFDTAKMILDSQRVKVVNLNPSSKLETFEKATFDSIFQNDKIIQTVS